MCGGPYHRLDAVGVEDVIFITRKLNNFILVAKLTNADGAILALVEKQRFKGGFVFVEIFFRFFFLGLFIIIIIPQTTSVEISEVFRFRVEVGAQHVIRELVANQDHHSLSGTVDELWHLPSKKCLRVSHNLYG